MFKEIAAAAWERRILSSNSPLALDSESEAMRVHVNLSEEDLTTEVCDLELRVLDTMARDPPPFYPGVQEKLDEEVRMEFYLCNEAYQGGAMEPIDVEFTDPEDDGCVRYMQFVPEQVGKPRKKEDGNGGSDEEYDQY
jgi:hypothetical protein